MKRRDTKIRRFVGGVFQNLAWRLNDPWDDWMVDYHLDGRLYGRVVSGPYHMARAVAKELGGKIVGHSVRSIPCDSEEDGQYA